MTWRTIGTFSGYASVNLGEVAAFASTVPPPGWLKCNGAAVSRADFAALFAAIGTRFGAGDGGTTFHLPDLRAEFIRGLDDGRGVDAGRVLGSAQTDEFKTHAHSYSVTVAGGADIGPGVGVSVQGSTTGSAGGTETRPRNVALLYCIKR